MRGGSTPLFLCYYIIKGESIMDRDRLKLIYKNLKSLLNALESEIYSDPDSYTKRKDYAKMNMYNLDTDDDDGYPD